jgi:hypothetical protein
MVHVQVLWIFSLYHQMIEGNWFAIEHGQEAYIFNDKGYPLLPWLTVPHKQVGVCHIILEALFN